MSVNTEVHDQALAAIRRAAVQESHEVRKLLLGLAQAHDEGINPESNVIITVKVWEADKVVGHLVITCSYGPAGVPVASGDYQPIRSLASALDRGAVQDG